jgi:hypothetical protein
MLHLTVDTEGRSELRHGRAMTPGMVGLYLVELAAQHAIRHPSTRDERIAFQRAMQLMGERPEPAD